MNYCECGCGAEVKNRFKPGHYAKLKRPPETYVDHSGEKYGKWTVIKKLYKKDRQQIYLCQCECGNQRQMRINNCKKSSMCLKCSAKFIPKNKKEYGYASKKSKLIGYKSSARRRNIEWSLTDEQAIKLLGGNCHYCGRKPYKVHMNTVHSNGGFLYNGIDRIDSDGGYTIDNCCSCCSQCNFAKLSMTENEFLNLIKLIYNNLIRKGDKICDTLIKEPPRMEVASA